MIPVKKIAILPTMLTLGNAICGFAAIACANKIEASAVTSDYFAYSGWLILGAMVFDVLDGYVARLSRTVSNFGGQLDSLCDAISFGVAPAFLVLKLGPGWDWPPLHQAVSVIATFYMVCTILRLARFNVENAPDPAAHKRFKGLPSPAAAGCVASLAIICGEMGQKWPGFDPVVLRKIVEVLAPLGALGVAVLMVSRVPYPHLTKQWLRGRRRFSHVVQIVLLASVCILIRELAVVLLFWAYALAFPVRHAVLRAMKKPLAPVPVMEKPVPH